MDTATSPDQTTQSRVPLIIAVSLFTLVIIRTAWVCDDAYITQRTVWNLIHGFGARWNVAERVQTYTHPLWMILLTAVELLTRESYFTTIVVSIGCSVATVWLTVTGVTSSRFQSLLAIALFIGSRAFVDYSTSGLENPLTNLLIVGYLILLAQSERRGLLPALILASMALVNRLDLIWLLGPSAAVACVKQSSKRWPNIALAALPIIVWEAFSIVYYGFAVPNTAYAKVQTGIGEQQLLIQGVRYVQDSLWRDPLTMAVVATSIGLSVLCAARSSVTGRVTPSVRLTIAAGQIVYLAYCVGIGGDFMSGRFLVAPFTAAVFQIATVSPPPGLVWRATIAALVGVLSFVPQTPSVLSDSTFGRFEDHFYHGITDERLFYFQSTGLLREHWPLTTPASAETYRARQMVAAGNTLTTLVAVGEFAYAAGPRMHAVDLLGLGDPLLARLPADGTWRIGHFRRRVPEGYLRTLRSGKNQIADGGVAAYYDELALITREPLWSWQRWRAIVRMNLGRSDHYLDFYRSTVPLPWGPETESHYH